MAMTITYPKPSADAPIQKVVCTWTSAADGTASATAYIYGEIIKGGTNPDDTAAPTANYDITLTDADGINVLAQSQDDLVDRHTSNSEEVYFLLKDVGTDEVAAYPVVSGAITVAVANAGDTKAGVLTLYVRGKVGGE